MRFVNHKNEIKIIEGIRLLSKVRDISKKCKIINEFEKLNSLDDLFLHILWEHCSYILQDILRGCRTEIDYVNGAVVKLGEKHGIETPYNNAVVRMVKAREGLGSDFSGRNSVNLRSGTNRFV